VNDSSLEFTISKIDWQSRVYLDRGAYSVVYRVAPNIVAKLRGVGPHGVDAQRRYNALGLALPVLASGYTTVPSDVAQELCPRHGCAKDLGANANARCSCDETYMSFLLTPEARRLSDEERRSVEYRRFRRRLHYRFNKDDYTWDFDNPGNIMSYEGKFVAIDFM
jgi:hypothetical protein